MIVSIVDTKRRLVLPGAKPGEAYAVREVASGNYELAKVNTVSPSKPTPEELDVLLDTAPLTPKMRWEDLRSLTREP